MKKFCKKTCAFLFLGIMTMNLSFAQQAVDGWIQFRGQDRNGIVNENLPLSADGKVKTKLVWKQKMGAGFSEILVLNDRIYTLYGNKIDSLHGLEYVVCYEAKTGKEIWKTPIDSLYIEPDNWGDGSRSTPCMDEENIYCFSGKGKLSAHRLVDGKMIWQIDFAEKYGSRIPRWGFSSSPLLVDGKLIMEVGAKGNNGLMAFNPKDGSEIWRNGTGDASFNSPVFISIDGQEQIVFLGGSTVQSFTPEGDTLWKMRLPIGGVIPLPLQFESNKLFFSNISRGFAIIEVNDNKAKEVLKGTSMKNDFTTSIYYNGYFYGYHVAALRCISAETGEVKWSKRGFGKGSLTMVGDKLLVLSDKGKLVFVEANPEAYIELGAVQAMDINRAWTCPSYYKGYVFVRNLEEIACYQLN